MPITIDLPPAIIQEAQAFAESRHTTIEKMVLDSFENEMKRQRELAEWEAEFDKLVEECGKQLKDSKPYKFNRADAYEPERAFA